MILFVDANAIVANPLLVGRQWESIGHAAATNAVTLLVPELAIDEAVARYRRTEDVRRRALKKEIRLWPRPARDHLSEAIAASSDFSERYETLLRDRLAELNASEVAYPQIEHEEVARRAIRRAAPFDEGGNGYRDTLHWYSFLQALEEQEADDPFAFFLSGDKKAFGPRRHAELQAEVREGNSEWTVSFLPQVADFVVPGQFFDDEMELDRAQERMLVEEVSNAVLVGGYPRDFTGDLANYAHFDQATVDTVFWLTVDTTSVQMERGSRDLWVTFTAKAMCDVSFESVEVLDEEAGELAVLRDRREFTLRLQGTAYVTPGGDAEVAGVRLDDFHEHPPSIETDE